MPDLVISDATEDDVARWYGIMFPAEWVGLAGRRGRLVTGFGGIFRGEGGWYGVMEVSGRDRSPFMYRHAKRILKSAAAKGADVVKAACDEDIPRARVFMERLGFVPTDEKTHDGRVVWQCLVSK